MKLAKGLAVLPAALALVSGTALALPQTVPAPGLTKAETSKTEPSKPAIVHAENPPPDPGLLRPSDSLRTGVLPNGLRYVLAHNDTPAQGVSIRLIIDAGTFDEPADERGAAHFVEHMAFAGAHTLSGDALSRAFESNGVEFARDLNANTELYDTIYKLDLPRTDAASLDLSFRWLGDVADGVDFPDAVVARERGVISAELMGRMTPDRDAAEALIDFEAPGTRLVERSKLDPAAAVQAITPAALSDFHRRWYRPDRAVVVVVGDMPLAEMASRVSATFGSWSATGPAPVRPAGGAPDGGRGEAAMVRAETTTVSEFSACRLHTAPDTPVSDVASLRREMSERLWIDILNRRLVRVADAPQPPFLRAEIDPMNAWRGVGVVCLSAEPLSDDWRSGAAAAQAELRRFAAEGPTRAEIAEALDRLRNAYWDETGVDGQSPALATVLAERTLLGEPFPDEAEGQRVLNLAVGDATPASVKADFVRDWSGSGPLVALVAPHPPDAQTLRAAWDAGEAAALLPAYADERSAHWRYGFFGWPGHVVRREVIADGDFVRLTFANGVIVNLKTTDFTDKTAEVRIQFGAGRREIPNGQYISAIMGAGVFASGGLGRMDIAQMREALSDHSWSAKLAVGDDAFDLSGSTTPVSLEMQLQVLTAYLTDPGFHSIDARLPTAIDAMYRTMKSNPALAMSVALERSLAPGGPNNFPEDPAALRMNTAQFQALLTPALREAPLEVTIVGNVQEKTVVRAIAHTLGALPARKPGDRARGDTWFRRIPDRPIGPIHVTLDGPQKAMVEDAWPLFTAGPDHREDEVAVSVLARVLRDALFQRVRQQLGETYTPMTAAVIPDRGDQGYLAALLDAAPADAARVQAEIGRTAAALAHGDITQAQLDDARAPLLAQIDSQSQTNAWWAELLDGSARRPDDLALDLKARAMIQTLTLAQLKAAAAEWLTPQPILLAATPAMAATAAGPAPALTTTVRAP